MVKPIPVNPALLTWARETAGLSIKDVVESMKLKSVTSETVNAWEAGTDYPTYAQLKKLAYKIYKRPLALFFFPNPPVEETPKQAFRTLPDYEINNLPSRMRLLIRNARAMQLNLSELYDNANPAKKNVVKDLSFDPNVEADKMAIAIRKYLQVDIQEQTKWKDSEIALKAWRDILEDNGVFIFKDAFQLKDFSGFCLYDDQFPIIYVNNSKAKNRQIFTLFHELAHLLFRTGGIDTRIEKYIDFLVGENRLIEILCNRFAGEFLVPSEDFRQIVRGRQIDDNSIQFIADHYNVSREVILRKAFDLNLVDQRYYQDKVEEWRKSLKEKKRDGGDYYKTKSAYLGEKYLGTAFSRYYHNRISIEQLSEYLGVKVKNVAGMEQLLLNKA
ncbi:MAG: ImmA/IrrE family metallo-endopeptidase [Candidatus Glassbacteria bacterium]|nr:ImmA/IrrE family metallo-endopeptidase [Candidatus Glassbacteria bacterium]